MVEKERGKKTARKQEKRLEPTGRTHGGSAQAELQGILGGRNTVQASEPRVIDVPLPGDKEKGKTAEIPVEKKRKTRKPFYFVPMIKPRGPVKIPTGKPKKQPELEAACPRCLNSDDEETRKHSTARLPPKGSPAYREVFQAFRKKHEGHGMLYSRKIKKEK